MQAVAVGWVRGVSAARPALLSSTVAVVGESTSNPSRPIHNSAIRSKAKAKSTNHSLGNVYKLRPRSYDRRVIDAFARPIIPKVTIPYKCGRRTDYLKKHTPFDYQLADAEDFQQKMLGARMIAVAQKFQMPNRVQYELNIGELRRKGILMVQPVIGLKKTRVYHFAFEGTHLERLEPLLQQNTRFFVGESVSAVKEILRLSKKMYWFELLAFVLDQKAILTVDQTKKLFNEGPLELLPAKTNAILRQPAMSLRQSLDSPGLLLARNLDNYQKMLEKGQAAS